MTLLAILKVTDARREIILAGGLNHRFPWRHLSPLTEIYRQPTKVENVIRLPTRYLNFNRQLTISGPSPQPGIQTLCVIMKVRQTVLSTATAFFLHMMVLADIIRDKSISLSINDASTHYHIPSLRNCINCIHFDDHFCISFHFRSSYMNYFIYH